MSKPVIVTGMGVRDLPPSVWLFHDGRPAHRNGALAVVDALNAKHVEFETSSYFAKQGWKDPFDFVPKLPWPDIAIAADNFSSHYVVRAIKELNPGTITASVGFLPLGSLELFDLVAAHESVEAIEPCSKVVVTTGTLTPVNVRFLEEQARYWKHLLDGCGDPKIGVIYGGEGVSKQSSEKYFTALLEALLDLERQSNCSFLFCSNSRTHVGHLELLRSLFPEPRHRFCGYDPGRDAYFAFIASSQAFIATTDSLSMISDASATGCPVHLLGLGEALQGTWSPFYQRLVKQRRIRPLAIGEVLSAQPKMPSLDEAQRVGTRLKEIWLS